MSQVTANLMLVKQRLELAALAAKREPEDIQLLAVSKTFPAIAVEEAMHAGQTAFGENYVQEGVEKIQQLAKLRPWLEWHFIGPIQSNKTQSIAQHFEWVHGVDRLKIAQRLNDARANQLPLQICLQVNISGEESKSGVNPEELITLAQEVTKLPHIKLRGLMAIPEPTEDPTIQRAQFIKMRTLFEHLNQLGYQLDTLSMGMSNDYMIAIEEGATIVRVGSAIFGARPAKD
mgnify:CR=1 FL=1